MFEPCLTIPKFLVLKNGPLVLFSWIVRLGIICLLIVSLLKTRAYLDEVSIGHGMDASLWVSQRPSAETLDKLWGDAMDSPLCKTPEIYDYWWDAVHKYETKGCRRLCGQSRTGAEGPCADALYIRERQDQLFFITREGPSDGFVAPTTSNAVFFPQVLALGVAVSFNYKVHVPAFDFPFFFGQAEHEHVGSSRRNLLAAVLDSAGQLANVFEPTSEIQFSLPELLRLSGEDAFLDAPDANKSMNQKPNATFQYPSGRVSGGALTLQIQCSNALHCPACRGEVEQLQTAWSSGSYDTICFVSVVLKFDQWAYQETTPVDSQGNAMHLTRSGLRVTIDKYGSFEYWKADQILQVFSVLFVCLKVADFIVLFVIVQCLGLMSSIYRRAIYDTFDFREQVAGMATRLVVASATFDQLQDPREFGITEDSFKFRVGRAFENRRSQLDDKERCLFATFCWEATTSLHQSPEPKHASRSLDIDNYSIAYSNFERLRFHYLAKLFDKDRDKSMLEQLFTPKHLSMAIAHAHKVSRPYKMTPCVEGQEQNEGTVARESFTYNPATRTEIVRFHESSRSRGDEALITSNEALAEIAGLRKHLTAQFEAIEQTIASHTNKLEGHHTQLQALEMRQDQLWAQMGMNDEPGESWLSCDRDQPRSRLDKLEDLCMGQRFEQLTHRITVFERDCLNQCDRTMNKFERRLERLETANQAWARADNSSYALYSLLDLELENTTLASVSDRQESLKAIEGQVATQTTQYIGETEAAPENIEEQFKHLAASVAALEEHMLAEKRNVEYLFSQLEKLPPDSNREDMRRVEHVGSSDVSSRGLNTLEHSLLASAEPSTRKGVDPGGSAAQARPSKDVDSGGTRDCSCIFPSRLSI